MTPFQGAFTPGSRQSGQSRSSFSRGPGSQAFVVGQPPKTIYVGGQNGVGADGKGVRPMVGEQARQVLRNLVTVLESEGASLANIVHWSIARVDGQALHEGFAAFRQAWNPADPPLAITVRVVGGVGPGSRRDRRHRRRVTLPQPSGATG